MFCASKHIWIEPV